MDKRFVTAVMGAAVLVTTVMATGATKAERPHRTVGDARESPAPAVTTGQYVVTYDEGPASARRAVNRAGGEVVEVNEQLDVALAAAPDEGFLTRVRRQAGVSGASRNHAVGTTRPGMPHRFAAEWPTQAERARWAGAAAPPGPEVAAPTGEPLASRQWDMAMIGASTAGAHARATGEGVRVGIIDTGIDAGHPDLAANVDVAASRNFTTDMPAIDGPCEEPDCVDTAPGDDSGHGTHVAGIVAAASNGLGTAGVAPDATLVDLRAGQDSGYFFLWETVSALTYAVEAGVDVVNMSFYVDPWLYNCRTGDDYVSGEPTASELAEQALTREVVSSAVRLAHSFGVTLVASAGNQHVDLAAPLRVDTTSPNHPAGAAEPRGVTAACLTMPSEADGVLAVSALGPSGTKADYSNYGLGSVDLSAPGGWLRDRFGTPGYGSLGNAVLSTYPLDLAIAQGLATPEGEPVDASSVRSCDAAGNCGFYTYLQGTSMAAPHVTGAAALVVEARGAGNARAGHVLAPDVVAATLAATARDRPCPAGGVEEYSDEARGTDWTATCTGTPAFNGFHGEGMVDAAAAVGQPPA